MFISSEAVAALCRVERQPERGRYCAMPSRGTLRRARIYPHDSFHTSTITNYLMLSIV